MVNVKEVITTKLSIHRWSRLYIHTTLKYVTSTP